MNKLSDGNTGNRKETDFLKLKYRIRILGAYVLFTLLCILIVQIKGSTTFHLDKTKISTAVIIMDNTDYTKDGVKFTKGDKIDLKLTLPSESEGKKIEVIYFDVTSGNKLVIYEGTAKKVLEENFIIKDDGRGVFIIYEASGKRNITDETEIYYEIKRFGDN
jgi:hypothetical protein